MTGLAGYNCIANLLRRSGSRFLFPPTFPTFSKCLCHVYYVELSAISPYLIVCAFREMINFPASRRTGVIKRTSITPNQCGSTFPLRFANAGLAIYISYGFRNSTGAMTEDEKKQHFLRRHGYIEPDDLVADSGDAPSRDILKRENSPLLA